MQMLQFFCKCFCIELSVKELQIAPVGVSNNSSDTYNLHDITDHLMINQYFEIIAEKPER